MKQAMMVHGLMRREEEEEDGAPKEKGESPQS